MSALPGLFEATGARLTEALGGYPGLLQQAAQGFVRRAGRRRPARSVPAAGGAGGG